MKKAGQKNFSFEGPRARKNTKTPSRTQLTFLMLVAFIIVVLYP
jgi:hypothetical protein